MPRGRENSRARIGASAIRPLEYFPYGLASPAQGGKQEANGGKLAFIRAVQAFTCHGGIQVARATPSFHPIDYYVTHRFFVSFLTQERNVPPRLPRPFVSL